MIGSKTLAAVVLTMALVPYALGVKEKVIHDFESNPDGAIPYASLVSDSAGNLYGTTLYGGTYGYGTVFELLPNQDGSWTEAVLHSFSGDVDGAVPIGPLTFDTQGNLYGTTSGYVNIGGTAFKMTPDENGNWTVSVLYKFGTGTDGSESYSGVVFDNNGNLYGTTVTGGTYGNGTVFELSPNEDGSWTESILYNFTGGKDGAHPQGGVVVDGAGNLYGTTFSDGAKNHGTVFELSPQPGGGWRGALLHTFTGGRDGGIPTGSLTFDLAGNLYGAATGGGSHGSGVIFMLTSDPLGGWKETIVHAFDGVHGGAPNGGLVFDASGNLYGTTHGGGAVQKGTVFRLSRGHGGNVAIRTFSFNYDNGYGPEGGVVLDAAGHVYGTTSQGGDDTHCGGGCGVVFQITP